MAKTFLLCLDRRKTGSTRTSTSGEDSYDGQLALMDRRISTHCEAMQVFSTRTYESAVRLLLREQARRQLEAAIVAASDAVPVIRGTDRIRKLRFAGSRRGKRDSTSTVCFYHADPEAVDLLAAHAKADREDLTPTEHTEVGRNIEMALDEVLGLVHGETAMPVCHALRAVAAEPAEVRRPFRPLCACHSGAGTRLARSGQVSAGPANRNRS